MKKTLSIFLALVLMLSFPMISFAADKNTIENGKEYIIETAVGKQNSTRYSFVPEEDGFYRISAEIVTEGKEYGRASVDVDLAEDNSYLASVSLSFNEHNVDDFLDDIFDFSYDDVLQDSEYFFAKGGSELNIRVYNEAYVYDDVVDITYSTVKLTVAKADDLREIKMNESYTLNGEDEYFILKPTEDCVFNIWSYDCSSIFVTGSDETACGDFMFGEFPIDFTFEAKAGESYLVHAGGYTAEDESSPAATFHVIDINGADDITVIRGQSDYFYVDIYPVGARYNCGDLDIKVGNGKIASAEYDAENEMIIVKGKRLGKTTLTVTDPKSGVTAEVEIEVVTRLTYFFREVFSFIYDFFESLSLR